MKAKELRIGNYVNYLGKEIKCGVNTIYAISKITQPSVMYLPIPLTEEWLLKFGFELNEDLGDMKYYQMPNKKRGFGVCFDHEEISFYLFNIKGIVNLIYGESFFEYVHYFQNLYFSLTNEELTFKQ